MRSNKDIEPKRTFDEYAEIGSNKAYYYGQSHSSIQSLKRTERIIAALYILTKNVPYEEPIRMVIRSNGHKLLNVILKLKSGFNSESNAVIISVSTICVEMISLIRILFVDGYISKRNAEILIRAVEDLLHFVLDASKSITSEESSFSNSDFSPSRNNIEYGQAVNSSGLKTRISSSDNIDNLKSSKKGGKQSLKRSSNREERKVLIIDTLRNGGKLGIKDISLQVVGFSEKTVQRELNRLVKEGLILKEGEKRWSKYSLNL
jgi:predicted transcriptional regulator